MMCFRRGFRYLQQRQKSMSVFGPLLRIGVLAGAIGVATSSAQLGALGVNHYGFVDGDAEMLAQLSQTPVPLRITFYWHRVAAAVNYYDPQVAAATRAGVPILGILAYSSLNESSMPRDFDFTELSPFEISWHTQNRPLSWGSNSDQGTAKYLWNATLEDGLTRPRVVAVGPPTQGGFIHGAVHFKVPEVSSVVLWANVGFLQGAGAQSRANFSVTYFKDGAFPVLMSLEKGYDGTVRILQADVTRLAGEDVELFFNVDPVKGASTEGAVWQAAGVLVNGAPLSMLQVVGSDLQSIISYPPRDPDAFATYAGNLARRYPQVQAWEVWNEPNAPFLWRPAANVAAYVTLLEKTYRAVKAANPRATVVLGGLSPGDCASDVDAVRAAEFLNGVYQLSGGAFFDAVGYHAYGTGKPSNWLPSALLEIRSVMDAYGNLRKPVWITEMGYYTKGQDAVSEQIQAEYLRDARSFFAHVPYLERVYWYTLRDASRSMDPENN